MKNNIIIIQKHIAGLKHTMNERINLIQGELEILKKVNTQQEKSEIPIEHQTADNIDTPEDSVDKGKKKSAPAESYNQNKGGAE